MSDFHCLVCLQPRSQVFAVLTHGVELPGLGFIHNPHLTACCQEGWDPLPPRGTPAFRIAIIEKDRPGFISSGIARYTKNGTPYCRMPERAHLFNERWKAERWIREHPLERGLKPRIEELEI